MLTALAVAAACAAGIGIAETLAGLMVLFRFRVRAHWAAPRRLPTLTVLKPLHGAEPLLEEALASFCAQDYPGLQLVFGVSSDRDPAIAVVRRLRARFPSVAIKLVIDSRQHGINLKVSSLINMLPAATGELLVISDSDIHAPPGHLRQVAACLADPAVGLVTSLYSGLPAHAGWVGRLGAAQITHAFLPGALLGRILGRQDCLGATMAMRRETLDRIGGLRPLVSHVADDALLGRLVVRQGLRIALANTVPATTVAEHRLPDLWLHELRWARTIRALAPIGLPLSALQYPVGWALLALLASGGADWTALLLAGAWGARAVAARGIDRTLGVTPLGVAWLLPLRDTLSLAVILASYAGRNVRWRGAAMQVVPPDLVHGEG